MDMKEVLIRVWEKMNCKEILIKHSVYVYSSDEGTLEIYYSIPRPIKINPDNKESRNLRFIHTKEQSGFTNGYPHTIDYPCTEKEAIEIVYTFHQIKNKLEEIKRDELLDFIQS